MKLGNIFYLLFLWLIPTLLLFYIYSIRKRKRLILKFAELRLIEKISDFSSRKIYYVKAVLILSACLFGIFALTEPKFGYKWEEFERKGIDVVIAVDVSKSMLANDIQPSRLERAKRKISDLLSIVQGDRLALVAFSGSSFLQCPLTLDYDAFRMFLDYLDPSLIPVEGTSIYNALKTSIDAFPKESSRGKAVILITDGEDHDKDFNAMIDTLKKENIRVFSIGIGKEDGSPIQLGDSSLKKDENGNIVLTKQDSSLLKNLSVKTRGMYVNSVSGDFDIIKIYLQGIRTLYEASEFKGTKKKIFNEIFQIFVGLALMLICLEFLISDRFKKVLEKETKKDSSIKQTWMELKN